MKHPLSFFLLHRKHAMPPALRAPMPAHPISAGARPLAIALALAALWLAAAPARADDGHDHGKAPAAASGPALPRFAASSERFELVGVLDGRQLTLYLDHADSNAPVRDARLALELGSAKLDPAPHGEGEFEVTLDEAPPAGVTAVSATVTTPGESDRLAGELDIHEDAHADEAHAHSGKERALWGAGGLAALVVLTLLVRRLRGGRALRAGGAA